MPQFQARFERLELKYLVDELIAERIRTQIAPYCAPDPYSRDGSLDRPGRAGYTIDSLYLDSPALAFHMAKVRGDPFRLKPRVRTYSATSPATMEVKRRHKEIIDKTRAVVDRRRVEDAARGLLTESEAGGESSAEFLRDFAQIVGGSGAHPTLTVRYEREAYEGLVDPYSRVTFDRRIRAKRTDDWSLDPGDDDWFWYDDYWKTDFPTLPVVVELKCSTSIPYWMVELIRRNDLELSSFSKYSIGIGLTHWQFGGDPTPARSPARALEVVA